MFPDFDWPICITSFTICVTNYIKSFKKFKKVNQVHKTIVTKTIQQNLLTRSRLIKEIVKADNSKK